MSDRLTTLLHERVHGVPTTLRPATDIRRRAEQHRRVRRAATGAGAGLLAVAIVLGVGLADARKRAVELPVTEQARGVALLLIADELPAAGPMTYQVTTGQREHVELAASCPRDMASLGAQTIWQRTFVGQALDREPYEKVQDANQVVAEFASPDAAATAFATIDGWFQACMGTNREPIRQPATSHAGGRALFVEILVDRPGYRLNHESTTYAINGAAITVVSVSHYAVDRFGHPDTRGRQETLAMFALQRLAGTRTITENAVPSAFRFAEEAKLRPSRVTALDHPWGFLGCRRADGPYRSADRQMRTGMLTLEGGGVSHQLAVYPDEETAQAVAQSLQAEISSCPKWTVEDGSRTDDVVLASFPRSGSPTAVLGVAIARWGNSIFLAVEGEYDLVAKPTAITQLDDALTANRPLVCRVAQGCS
jgi:hypothetical protein